MTATNQVKKTLAKTKSEKITAQQTSLKDIQSTVDLAVDSIRSEVAEQTTSLREAVNKNSENVRNLATQVWFASLGAVGCSFDEVSSRYNSANEELKTRYQKLNHEGQKLVEDLVKRGEIVQDDAEVFLKGSQVNIEEQMEVAKNRVTKLVSVVDLQGRLQKAFDKLQALNTNSKKWPKIIT